MTRHPMRETELNAILVAPNRELADLFLATVPRVRGFQILGDLRTYPPQQTLEIRLRQLQPEVALIDLTSDFEQAGQLIRYLSSLRPPIHVVGLHSHNDSEAILRSVRMGASEFLYVPFDPAIQQEAVARLRKMRGPETGAEPDQGKIIVFSSSKPGSGASTLATQTAFALKRSTGRRVLLADFDLTGGTIGFFLETDTASIPDGRYRCRITRCLELVQLHGGLWRRRHPDRARNTLCAAYRARPRPGNTSVRAYAL